MVSGPDVSSLRRRLELGRLVIGSLVELGIKAYGVGAALSVAVSDAETVGGKGQDALAAVPNLADRYRAAEYVVEHRQEIQAALDHVNQNTPPQAELEDAAARSSETLRDIETTSDEVDAALGPSTASAPSTPSTGARTRSVTSARRGGRGPTSSPSASWPTGRSRSVPTWTRCRCWSRSTTGGCSPRWTTSRATRSWPRCSSWRRPWGSPSCWVKPSASGCGEAGPGWSPHPAAVGRPDLPALVRPQPALRLEPAAVRGRPRAHAARHRGGPSGGARPAVLRELEVWFRAGRRTTPRGDLHCVGTPVHAGRHGEIRGRGPDGRRVPRVRHDARPAHRG